MALEQHPWVRGLFPYNSVCASGKAYCNITGMQAQINFCLAWKDAGKFVAKQVTDCPTFTTI